MKLNKQKEQTLFDKLKENVIIKQIALLLFIYVSFDLLAFALSILYFLTGTFFLGFFADYGADSGSFIISFVLTIIYYPIHNILTWSKKFRSFRYNFRYIFLVTLTFLTFGSYLVIKGAELFSNFGSIHSGDLEREGAILLSGLLGYLVFSVLLLIISSLTIASIFTKLKQKKEQKMKNRLKVFMWIGIAIIILILVVLISFQVSYYKKERQISAIKLGESTRSQIETMLGTPLHMANQEEGVVCDNYEVEKITKSPLFIANIEKGVLGCLQIFPESKDLKRCVYSGNPSILRFRFEDSIEIFYNEDETVCSIYRHGL